MIYRFKKKIQPKIPMALHEFRCLQLILKSNCKQALKTKVFVGRGFSRDFKKVQENLSIKDMIQHTKPKLA